MMAGYFWSAEEILKRSCSGEIENKEIGLKWSYLNYTLGTKKEYTPPFPIGDYIVIARKGRNAVRLQRFRTRGL